MLEDEGTGLAHVCQTALSDAQGEFNTVDIDPLADVLQKELSVTTDRGCFSECSEWQWKL